MKIKRPSLKGMKNTKYLGHFAQDKYIKKGHNLSGSFPMFREPSQLEMMGPANPFDASAELKRRQAQVDAEAAALRQTVADNTGEVAMWNRRVSALETPRPTDLKSAVAYSEQRAALSPEDLQYLRTGGGSRGLGTREPTLEQARQSLASAQARSKEGREKAFRSSRKKFITEV
jgi:hypothetical protein